jgi:hypothetical protein
MSITSRYPLGTSRSTPSDTYGGRLAMPTLLVPIAAVLIRTWHIAIGMSVFNVPSRRIEHVQHSSIVPKLDLDTWFRSVDLHHRYFVVRRRYLSINPWISCVKMHALQMYTGSYFAFHTFWVWALKLTNKTKKKNYPKQIQNTNPFTDTFAFPQPNTTCPT